MNRFFLICMIALILLPQENSAVTLVYNLKVRRSFTVPPALKSMNLHWIVSAVPIIFARKAHIVDPRTNLDVHEKRRAGGSLFNMQYVPSKHWWAGVTTGIEVDHGAYKGSDPFSASRMGLDDIVFDGGYRHFIENNTQLVGYVLVGLPAQRNVDKTDRRGPLVGTRCYNLGCGVEGSYSFINQSKRSFTGIIQGRIIHEFSRSWFPVLPHDSKIQPGNFSDLLFTLQFRERKTILEAGYNVTIFSGQALLLATGKVSTDTFLQHSGYATLSHAWLKGPFGKPWVFGVGCNLGRSKKFDAKTFTGWLYATIVF